MSLDSSKSINHRGGARGTQPLMSDQPQSSSPPAPGEPRRVREADPPDRDSPGLPTWASRHRQMLEQADAARLKVQAAPKDATLESARLEALGDVVQVERSMATDLILMLRKADQWSGLALRAVLSEVFKDVVTGLIDGLTTDVQDLTDAVAALEQVLRRKAVVG